MYDIAIIGAGPAGATAALFAAKAGKKTVLVDDGKSVTKRALMKNYYAIPEITGPAMIEAGKQQVAAFGGELVEATVSTLSGIDGGIRLQAGDRQIDAKHVVLATGMVASLAEASGIRTKPGTEPRVKTIVDVDSLGRTSVPGIWAAGTIAGASMHIVITAGEGAKVAINILSELNGERYVDHDVLPAPANA
jgi:thioredoxin reductase